VELFNDNAEDFSSFIKDAYKHLNTAYPKFFKMDNLSKLGFLAADLLLREESLSEESASGNRLENNIALVFSNSASSLDTDRKHQSLIQNSEAYFPSPAVFVYTLPNIGMGEISIRHKLFSENSFFIFDRFNAAHLQLYASHLLKTEKAEKVLCGWVEFDKDTYHAFLYLVEKEGEIEHKTEEINRLFNTL
tara:strand:+ start:505 stop:1077 length:573 start_codon:yes stop_codon:yes gene_type:complete